MKHITYSCDVERDFHENEIKKRKVPVMFEYDQEDGKYKLPEPHFEMIELHLCNLCWRIMTKNKVLINGYGAMGYNKYYIYEDK